MDSGIGNDDSIERIHNMLLENEEGLLKPIDLEVVSIGIYTSGYKAGREVHPLSNAMGN